MRVAIVAGIILVTLTVIVLFQDRSTGLFMVAMTGGYTVLFVLGFVIWYWRIGRHLKGPGKHRKKRDGR